jgi:hypothetical protein
MLGRLHSSPAPEMHGVKIDSRSSVVIAIAEVVGIYRRG